MDELNEQIRELIAIARQWDKDEAFAYWADQWLSGDDQSAGSAQRMNTMLRERIDPAAVYTTGSSDFFANAAVAATDAVMLLHTDLPLEDKHSTIEALLNNTRLSIDDYQKTLDC
ncbi:hypothetical protein CCAX7_24700 [Capsulimonas corticalis]|uniref:Uncharacterized protein n=1 Tax=Capsulimonas corticalis TaxID=2219043 RepID=A0A402CVI9_9BACT|nr:hypothetical protein [Capsulimonas corticalis]BDI30419.1 hypothetical protein CCAX7_24700 [Capsulimonas corticalis]